MKVQAKSFHLNGHIVEFRPQTQKLESPYKTPSGTLAVKGLNNNDRDQALRARETEQSTQTLVFTKTAGRQPG